jgi:hypothetical protein
MTLPGPAAAQPAVSSELYAPHQLSVDYRDGSRFMGIRLLGALRLKPVQIDGQPLRELSGLAWDQDEGLLYAVSDGGALFHLRPEFEGGMLTGLSAVAGYALEGPGGRPRTGAWADSEDLAIENGDNGIPGDSRLVISFERRPRLGRYSTDGRFLEPIPLPAPLSDVASYASANKSLESVARHPALGWLAAPEWPLRGSPTGTVEIWSTEGVSWPYRLRDVPNNALVAMDALEDGALVTLERGHGLLYSPLIISLRRTLPLAEPGIPPQVTTAAVFDSSAGWRIDNFEGLARHRALRFFLVSDDNENPLQVTLLVYLELVDPVPTDYGPGESGTRQENRR